MISPHFHSHAPHPVRNIHLLLKHPFLVLWSFAPTTESFSGILQIVYTLRFMIFSNITDVYKMLTETGVRKLTELRRILIGDGFTSIDFLTDENLSNGDPRVFLAIAGYLHEVMYKEVVLKWHDDYSWYGSEQSDYEFVEKLWKVVHLETGKPTGITLAQFFSAKFADLKIGILLSLTKLMKNSQIQLKKQKNGVRRSAETAPVPATPPTPLQNNTVESLPVVRRPTQSNQAVVFKPLPRRAYEP